MKKDIRTYAKTLVLALALAVGVGYISAWTGPTAAAPNGNVDAPINTGSIGQTKWGPLVVNYAASSTPGLEILGAIQIVDKTQGAGKVLMSDASGVSHWAATSTLGLGGTSASSTSHNIYFFDAGRSGGGGTVHQVTFPAGVTSVKVRMWGGGGGGSGNYNTDTTHVGGGGAYVEAIVPVTPGTIYAAIAGFGGLDSAANGHASTFGVYGGATILTAGGGNYMNWNTNKRDYSGGVASGGQINIDGTDGGLIGDPGALSAYNPIPGSTGAYLLDPYGYQVGHGEFNSTGNNTPRNDGAIIIEY